MKSVQKKEFEPPMRKEFDFRSAVIGKYAKRYVEGSRVARSAAKVKKPR
jgi:hypothetical protein